MAANVIKNQLFELRNRNFVRFEGNRKKNSFEWKAEVALFLKRRGRT